MMTTITRTIFITILLLAANPVLAASFETREWQTTNGARVVFHHAPEVPMLDINVAFAAGSARDGAQFGLSALTTNLMDQGNGGLKAGEIADKFADTGAQYGLASAQDMMMLSLRTLTTPEALNKATELFALLVNHPDFPEDAFNREKNQQLLAIKQREESPDKVAKEAFYQALYDQHPYAHPVNGLYHTVEALEVRDVRHFHHHYIVGSNAVIVLVGGIDEAMAHQLAERIVHDLPKGQPAPPLPKATPLTKELNIEIPHPASQTVLRMGQLGITHQNKDYFPLLVGNYILGGGSLVSILADELREKRGLTYGVYSEFSPMPGVGPFMISLSTRNNQAKTAMAVTHETLAAFVKSGPTEQELRAAKQYLTGSFPLSLDNNRSIANTLLRLTFYHLPKDFLNTYIAHVNAVSTADIKQAFQQQIHPDKLLQVSVGRK